MSIWSRLFRRKSEEEERLSLDDWAQTFNNVFSFNGNTYPIGNFYPPVGSNVEETPNDFRSYVEGAYKSNGIVFACAMTRQLVFTEMRFVYQQMSKGRPTNMFGSQELSVLEKPWPNGTTGELLSRAMQDTDLAGNHYIVREGAGQNSRLRRLRPDWVDIILTAPPDMAVHSDVAGYLYKPGGTQDPEQWITYPIDGSKGAIAHWTPIPDPEAQYRGMSWLTPILREIMADKGASTHKQKFFEQGATPQLAVSFKDTVTPEQFNEFMDQMNSAHAGVDNAYKTMYLAGGADVTVVGAHLAQLDFRNMQGHGETRIAAAARVHPVLVGLSEALHGTPLNIGNYQAAKDMFGEATLRPLWRSLCAAYQPLVHEFPGARLWYDDRDISFLRQDRQAQAELQLTEAQTASALIQSGYDPDSVAKFMLNDGDWSLLKHSGLFSVQLQPPGSDMGPGESAAPEPDTGTEQSEPDAPTDAI